MIWSVDMDDFRGQCSTGKYPLINAMKNELESYSVKLEYDGPYESSNSNGQYTTKDREYQTSSQSKLTVNFLLILSNLLTNNFFYCSKD